MISRIWHGWTTPENADRYEELLRNEIIPGIAKKEIDGYKSFQLLKRSLENEVEFITLLRFDSWEAVKKFAGEDYKHAYVPAKAREILKRFDDRARHYEVREQWDYE